MVTIKDVALRAGVTKQTVSNVINQRPVVKPATRERVQQAIAELGYTPNLIARGLATGQSMMIGLVVPTLANPFYTELIERLERCLEVDGYGIALCTTDGDPDRATQQLVTLKRRYIDGLILFDDGNVSRHLDLVRQLELPFVLCGSEPEIPAGTPVVTFDHARAGYLAGEHLRELGHREIAVVGEFPAHRMRLYGAERALAEGSIAIRPTRIVSTPEKSQRGGVRAATQLLADHPEVTAIIATHDLLALGVLQAAGATGRRVPDDLSVIGIDNIAAAASAEPPLTTVAFPIDQLAQESVDHLLGLLRLTRPEPAAVSLTPRLVVRESTAPPH
ncbi:LacI family transcriptional regulator [Kribbella antiqua]|uniref:LacI family transcriptional regulator n=1 Tax=Kribbella antiqua TaxID=2512217 RepID=A0A4R2J155_9ACTN|nr:LacI family DNA-binding transcriptional regulator [Kribbella antiqua]TCO50438.1 LacI family transcriptional regulator [Kribbella antiqua]